MNYLIYIEHSAENLQFYLWYQDYVKRFSAMRESEQALSPEWTVEKAEADAIASAVANQGTKKMTPEAAAIFKDTDFAQPIVTVADFNPNSNPFHTPPHTPDGGRGSVRASETAWDDYSSTVKSSRKDYVNKAADAYEAADVKYQPCKWELSREASGAA